MSSQDQKIAEAHSFAPTPVSRMVPRSLMEREVARQLPAYWVIATTPELALESFRCQNWAEAMGVARDRVSDGQSIQVLEGRRLPFLAENLDLVGAPAGAETYVREMDQYWDPEDQVPNIEPEALVALQEYLDARYWAEVHRGREPGELFPKSLIDAVQPWAPKPKKPDPVMVEYEI